MKYWKMYKDKPGVWHPSTLHEAKKAMVMYCFNQHQAKNDFRSGKDISTHHTVYRRSESNPND